MEPDSGFCESVGLLHPANIFPRPVSTQDLQRSYHTLYLLFICIQYHHLCDYPVLLRNNTILIGLQDVCRPQLRIFMKGDHSITSIEIG